MGMEQRQGIAGVQFARRSMELLRSIRHLSEYLAFRHAGVDGYDVLEYVFPYGEAALPLSIPFKAFPSQQPLF